MRVTFGQSLTNKGMTVDAALKLVEETPQAGNTTQAYRVLARKYRPSKLSELVGQETLTTILKHGIESGRLGHAFILTGIRGTGKTTTARIIARSLNCTGPDDNGQPTIDPCGVCASCTALSQDRHMDVIEIDAASRTSVDDVREIIEAARYKPVSARYKIYIIDEVHMLSKSAFNALLKTLEEPPAYVKFIFATTEIQKVPQTILSRCVRFDLARIAADVLCEYFKEICTREQATFEDDAIAIIAKAADGSVRDGLSILDQAMTQGLQEKGVCSIKTEAVRRMLGHSDQAKIYALFQSLSEGNLPQTLTLFRELYQEGGEVRHIFEGLLDTCCLLTRLQAAPELAQDPTMPETDRTQGLDISSRLSVSQLSRVWQMLLKGYGELSIAPSPEQAGEMVLIRTTHTANLPSIYEIIKQTPEDGSKKKP